MGSSRTGWAGRKVLAAIVWELGAEQMHRLAHVRAVLHGNNQPSYVHLRNWERDVAAADVTAAAPNHQGMQKAAVLSNQQHSHGHQPSFTGL